MGVGGKGERRARRYDATYFTHDIHLRDNANRKGQKVQHKVCVIMASLGDCQKETARRRRARSGREGGREDQ